LTNNYVEKHIRRNLLKLMVFLYQIFAQFMQTRKLTNGVEYLGFSMQHFT